MLVFTSLLYILHSTTSCSGLNSSASSSYASGSFMTHAQLVSCSKKYGTGIRTNSEGKTATQPAATYRHLKEGPMYPN